MTSVRSLTLTLLATVILGLGTLQFAQAQGTNQPGNNSQSQAGTQAQSQTSPRGQSAGADQGAVGNRQGAANNMSAGRQQGASNNIRSMQMQNSGGKSMARGSTTVTTQRNVTLRDGRSYAVYGHPQNRTTIIRQGQQSDRYVYLHNKRHHGPSDRYVVLHKKRYYGYAPSGSTTIINRYQRGGHAVGGVSGGSARIGTQQTTTTTTRSATGVNAGTRANGQSAVNINRGAGGASNQGNAGGMAQHGGNQAGQSANKPSSAGAASNASGAGGSSAR